MGGESAGGSCAGGGTGWPQIVVVEAGGAWADATPGMPAPSAAIATIPANRLSMQRFACNTPGLITATLRDLRRTDAVFGRFANLWPNGGSGSLDPGLTRDAGRLPPGRAVGTPARRPRGRPR